MTSRALIALFLAGIAVPCVGTVAGIATGTVIGENRYAAPVPDFATATPKEIPRQIDAWFADHFGFRRPLVTLNSAVRYFVFGVSPAPQVVIGRDGWLFYADDRIIPSRYGLVTFTPEQLRAWQARLEERRGWLARHGIRYLFVVAPEKSSVYPERLPGAWQSKGPAMTDQLLAWMREHSTVPVLDLRPPLLAAKSTERVYHLTDSHWNDVGALAAYRAVVGALAAWFPGLEPLDRSRLERTVTVTAGGDLAGILGLVPYLAEERIVLSGPPLARLTDETSTDLMRARAQFMPQAYGSPDGAIARAVVVHDSFFEPPVLMRALATHFRRSVFIKRVFPPEIIMDEKPDVVIEEMVERSFSRPGFLPESELADWQ
jgi:hypothetical protein